MMAKKTRTQNIAPGDTEAPLALCPDLRCRRPRACRRPTACRKLGDPAESMRAELAARFVAIGEQCEKEAAEARGMAMAAAPASTRRRRRRRRRAAGESDDTRSLRAKLATRLAHLAEQG